MIPLPAPLAFVAACLNPAQPAWPKRLDWEAIAAAANGQLVTPALFLCLKRQGRLPALPQDLVDYLAMLHAHNQARNAALRRQAVEAVAALNAAGIEPMLLKGGLGLFTAPHCADTARMMADLDILVPGTAAEPAVTALTGIGYEVLLRYPSELHSYADLGRPGKDQGGIDLHQEVVRHTYLLPAQVMWRQAQPIMLANQDGGGRGTGPAMRLYAPSPSCRVLHNLLHSQAHDRGFYHGVLRLRDLQDLASIVRSHAAEIDWPWIEGCLAQHRLEIVLDAQLLMAEHLLGLAWPLARAPLAGASWHRERCLAQLHSARLAQLGRFWGNFRLAFAWHRLSRRYGGRGNLLIWQLRHAADILSRLSPARLLGEIRRRN